MDIRTVRTDGAPRAIGPYSQAVVAGGFVFCSGQIPLDPVSGELVGGDIGRQTAQVLKNLQEVLRAAGSSIEKVVKTTVYLKNMDDYAAMNEVYGQFFGGTRPARAAVQVARLPKDVCVEIEAMAVAG